MTLALFVYGTLRPGERNHGVFLGGRTRLVGPGLLDGAVLYDGPGHPYAVEEPGGVVHGELLTAPPEAYEELLAGLDRLEGYVPGDPAGLYERVERTVARVPGGQPVRAWVYVAAPAVAARLRERGRLIAGGDWRARR
ncbi:gamma-glutamylcyclotransferase family protein [Streptomyces sp. NPDC046831]|uniref:gamma-glutamylcyclotransferase family protein n=1 Tax=Streptomyces sp. NPDC046831 TaxID=3154805 RepID=UPI00340B8F8A